MNTEARSEFEAHYYDRVGKIREAATAAIRQLGQLRSTGPTQPETLDAEVARIAQESCTLTDAISLFIGWDDGLTQFLIKVQIATK